MKALSLALLLLFGPEPSWASSQPPPLEGRIRALMPKGFTARQSGLPPGVLVAFLGPRSPEGQVTVTVTRLPADLATEAPAPELSQALEVAGLAAEVEPQGPLDGLEIKSRPGPLMTRQWVIGGPVSYLVTIAAPAQLLDRTADQVLKAATAFRSSLEAARKASPTPTPRPSPGKGLDSKSAKRPDGASPPAIKGQAD